ncbi:MAG: tail fiber protein [Myxococcaceae bacterium]
MSTPFVGEIRMFAGNFPPAGWAFCDGQFLPISENETLFFLIGTTYGGDGQSTFALPDLRGRVPVHQGPLPGGSNYVIGMTGGQEAVTLTTQQIPAHGHALLADAQPAESAVPAGRVPAETDEDVYATTAPTAALAPTAIAPTGGSQPHSNVQPYLCIHFIISLFGIFPQQN